MSGQICYPLSRPLSKHSSSVMDYNNIKKWKCISFFTLFEEKHHRICSFRRDPIGPRNTSIYWKQQTRFYWVFRSHRHFWLGIFSSPLGSLCIVIWCSAEHVARGFIMSRGITNALRKHAYLNILKILPPKNENFQIKKPWYFSYFCSKHRSARRF